MRARFHVDYNEKLKAGDDVPAHLVRRMLRTGLGIAVPDEAEPGDPPAPVDDSGENQANDAQADTPPALSARRATKGKAGK